MHFDPGFNVMHLLAFACMFLRSHLLCFKHGIDGVLCHLCAHA